ncbi:hypothetical protein SSP35_22_00410 [Streptomyces sp. NBRC 110611]|uniref:hypothetical protein n=1 Tax=Streptomyces sp. NBRC 110611 TaxID=1621259 RepID=UPI00085670B3|nr:hypothetical protein [Streptomyces sp. NBRC 110611]GAU70738.1 hypothetical protein SSP35_22_00410 [Streptomyces sp. NBRC 110611]
MPDPTTDQTLRELQQVSLSLRRASEQLELLDRTGQVPIYPLFGELIQHVAVAQNLSHTTAQLATGFSVRLDAPSEELSRAHSHLVTAVAHTCSAVALFARTAQTSTSPAPAQGTPDAERRQWKLVLDHAEGRAELRRASEAVSAAAKHLQDHHDLQQFLSKALGRATDAPKAAPPSPRRSR